jgi:hypothetical protein
MTHTLQAEKLFIKAPRLGQAVALQRAVREHIGLDHRLAVLYRDLAVSWDHAFLLR